MNNIYVTQPSLPDLKEYIEEIRTIWDTHWLTNMGPKHEELKRKLAEYLQVENIELLTNGHMALELALQALNLQGEVITTPFTFASTTHAIVRNGLKPVFCDINSDDYTIDVSKIEELINENTCAIMPVHVYGNVCDIDEIERIASKYGLKVIYDAAHAFGETYKGRGIGDYGDVSCFSFHATKVYNTIEGGAVCFHSKQFGENIYNLKNFGIRGPESVESVGANAKLNEFCAAMGLCNLRHVTKEIEKRKVLVECYREHLDGVPGIKIAAEQKDVRTNYAYFPIVINKDIFGADRDDVFEKLGRHGIGARKYFYPLTNDFECYRNKYNKGKTPVAEHISNAVLTLPLYADLEASVVEKICELILGDRS